MRAARTKPCLGNETSARSVFAAVLCRDASRVAKELMLKSRNRAAEKAAAKFTQLFAKLTGTAKV